MNVLSLNRKLINEKANQIRLDRLYELAPGVLRGSQPGARQSPKKSGYGLAPKYKDIPEFLESDLLCLRELNIKSIVSFRNPKFLTEERLAIEAEERMSKKMGLQFFNFPVPTAAELLVKPAWTREGQILNWIFPQDALVSEILTLIHRLRESSLAPYIHCMAGKDRTGFIAALYQVYYLNADPVIAEDEWIAIGRDARELSLIHYFASRAMNESRNRGVLPKLSRLLGQTYFKKLNLTP